MSDSIQDVDARRARWRRSRVEQNLVDASSEHFARGGLGGRVAQLDVRMLFLAQDPEADLVPLDADAVAWIREPRASPWDGQELPLGSRDGASSDAVFVYDSWRDDGGWDGYVAIHRHGGLDLATRCAYQFKKRVSSR